MKQSGNSYPDYHTGGKETANIDIHTNQLRYFMELANCLSFTKAALNLYITQPTLSQQITDLEKQLGVTLFDRTTRSVSLTPAGELLKESCPELLAKMAGLRQQLLSAQAGLRGNLRIAYVDAFQSFLPDLLQKYCALYPDVSVELFTGNLREVQSSLRNGDSDICFSITGLEPTQEQNTYACQSLWQEDLCLVIRKDHPFVTSGGKDFSMLENELFTLLDEEAAPGYHTLLQVVCSEVGFHILKPPVYYTKHGPMAIQIATGMYASILPSDLSAHLCASLPNVTAIPLKKDCLNYCALWNQDSQNATVPLFLEVLESNTPSK